MEDSQREGGIGRRIRAVRKARGIKSTADLAALIPGSLISGAVLRNIEAGVKTDLSISQLLNVARALNVSPIYLLVSIRQPESSLDVPNLSDDLNQMTAVEFDAWFSGTSDSIFDWTTAEDLSERGQLRAMRELERQSSERDRLSGLMELAHAHANHDELGDIGSDMSTLVARREDVLRQIERLAKYLKSAGWNVERWI